MVLQSSGLISLEDIADEFGGAAPDTLAEYYRGGGLVPNTEQNAGIPTSGLIKLSDFYSASATSGEVTLSNLDITVVGGGVSVTAGFGFNSNGSVDQVKTSSSSFINDWWSEYPEAGIGSDYDVRCSALIEGTWSSQAAAVGTWIRMNTTRIWKVTSVGGTKTCQATFEIRPHGGGSVLDTGILKATAQKV